MAFFLVLSLCEHLLIVLDKKLPSAILKIPFLFVNEEFHAVAQDLGSARGRGERAIANADRTV